MSLILLCLVPCLAGMLAFFPLGPLGRRSLLLGTAVGHAGLTLLVCLRPLDSAGSWLGLDALGRLFLPITSLIFLAASFYAVGYLNREVSAEQADMLGEGPYVNAGEGVFVGCLLLFLGSMSLVCLSRHLTMLWIAVEATTLASAPLIYFHRHRRSLEATWKYLLVCSVGIGLALLGNFMLVLAVSGQQTAPSLQLDQLLASGQADPKWLRLAFILLLVGYGTKMGLAPLHTWLPDTHSESPSVVSALLSGALLNCAFLSILRVVQICQQAGLVQFAHRLLLLFGLLSMLVAALFLVGSRDYKRMLAYSSVEHMGILAFGVGMGGAGIFGSLLHALGHSLTKAALFMTAGNILEAYRTRKIAEVRGVMRRLPISGWVWMAGLLALVGSPPFVPFVSELTILKAALARSGWLAAGYLALLGIAFLGMSRAMLHMGPGSHVENPTAGARPESLSKVLPPLLLVSLALMLGLYVPAWLVTGLRQAAELLGGSW